MSETGAVPFEQKAQSSPSIVAIVVFSPMRGLRRKSLIATYHFGFTRAA
jgi:hypothetical protein